MVISKCGEQLKVSQFFGTESNLEVLLCKLFSKKQGEIHKLG